MTNLVSLDLSGKPLNGGSHLSTGIQMDTGWHMHDMHQFQYAFEGMIEIEDEIARYLVPHQYAAWIPAGTRHRTRLQGGGSGSVFLRKEMIEAEGDHMRIIRVPPLMREMILESMRWPRIEGYSDETGNSFFTTFALLSQEWLTNTTDLVLPTSSDPRIGKIIDFTVHHLDNVTLDGVCKNVAMSPRTLRRRFADKMGISWEEFRLRCRIFKAIELLEESTLSILEIATQVGYKSQSAFAKSFKTLLNDTPTAYRRRRLRIEAPSPSQPEGPSRR